ncbi:hypothetical protein SH611_12365 [Geminicoccaceae bacterium 1502E]|nr:hypothetical protein [Geminicoccaceae bacterium 1502E]
MRIAFAGIVLLLLMIALELIGLASGFLLDDAWDEREAILAQLDAGELRHFAQKPGDPVLGWDHHGPKTLDGKSCEGTPTVTTYDASGARVYEGYEP